MSPKELPYLPLPDQCASLKPMACMLEEDVEVSEEWLAGIVEFGFGGGFVRMLDDARGGIRMED